MKIIYIFKKKIILILPNPTVLTRNVTRNYAGNYADFALQVIFRTLHALLIAPSPEPP